MATDLGRNKSASTAEYENRVQDQLAAPRSASAPSTWRRRS